MSNTNTIINQQERIEAIEARLSFVVGRMSSPYYNKVYTLPSTGKKIDFSKQKNGWKLSRLIWRIGELKVLSCLDNLLKISRLVVSVFLNKNEEMTAYSFLWTLGRIGKEENIKDLQSIMEKFGNNEKLLSVYYQSLLQLSPEKDSKSVLPVLLISNIPEKVIKCVSERKFNFLEDILNKSLTKNSVNNWLYIFYLLHYKNEKIKFPLLSVLKEIPMKGNYFKPVRMIMKAAEQFDDVETLALLYWKIYTSNSQSSILNRREWKNTTTGWRPVLIGRFAVAINENGQSVTGSEVEKEVKKGNSDFGFTPKTQTYLKARFLRLVLKSGDANSLIFTRLATEFLLFVNDENVKKAYTERYGTYRQDARSRAWNYVTIEHHYLDHWDNAPLHKLLHSNLDGIEINSRLKGVRSKTQLGQLNNIKRVELFPKLWDNSFEEIILLLGNSHSRLVQNFAIRVFKDNPDFEQKMQASDLSKMLQVSFLNTQQLAFDIIKNQTERLEDEKILFLLLLNSKLEGAEQFAFDWMNRRKMDLVKDYEFVAEMIVHPNEKANNWIKNALIKSNEKYQILDFLLDFMLKQNSSINQKTIAFIQANFEKESQKISIPQLELFIKHPQEELNVFAVVLIKKQGRNIEDIPYDWMVHLLEAPSPKVRAAGIELFGLLSEEELYKQQVTVASLCVSPSVEVRNAAMPIAIRLSQKYADFGESLAETLSDFLLLREKSNDIHTSIVELLTDEKMSRFLENISSNKIRRLLSSKKYPAQQVGFQALKIKEETVGLEIEDFVTLGKHEVKDIREWAFKNIIEQKAKAIYEADKTLRLLETDWEDSRLFMMNFSENEFKERDWTPDLLVSLCDSTRDDIQAFGTKMIKRYFKEENAADFLLKLSQHPSARIQLLTAEWLEEYAAGKEDVIKDLEEFFIISLSQINKGRTAKNKVFDFLKKEALERPETAERIIPILERLSLTVAIGDKAKCILMLNEIRKKFPHLNHSLIKSVSH